MYIHTHVSESVNQLPSVLKTLKIHYYEQHI